MEKVSGLIWLEPVWETWLDSRSQQLCMYNSQWNQLVGLESKRSHRIEELSLCVDMCMSAWTCFSHVSSQIVPIVEGWQAVCPCHECERLSHQAEVWQPLLLPWIYPGWVRRMNHPEKACHCLQTCYCSVKSFCIWVCVDKSVCHCACLCQFEEDHRYNVWRQTSCRVWLWRGESFFDLKKRILLLMDGFSQVQQTCLHVLHNYVYTDCTVLWCVGGERLLHCSKGPRSHCVHHRDRPHLCPAGMVSH